jgi:coenzyme F420 hydrogenase subunit beta
LELQDNGENTIQNLFKIIGKRTSMIIQAQIGACGTCINSNIYSDLDDVYFVAHSLAPERGILQRRPIENLPDADIGIIDGPICFQGKEESIQMAEMVREKSKILLGLGTCTVGSDTIGGFITKDCSQLLSFFCPYLRTRHPKIEKYISFDYKLPVCSANQEGLRRFVKAALTEDTSYLEYFKDPGANTINVITEADCCMGCGTCGMVCPTGAISYVGQRPKIDAEVCIKCGACFIQCPRSFFSNSVLSQKRFQESPDPLLGFYREAYSARTQDARIMKISQDGGIVTNLLCYLLREQICDAAVVSVSRGGWDTVPEVVTTPEEVLKAAGTKYTVVPNLMGIKKAADQGYEKIAFVGVPCQVQGVVKTDAYPFGDRYYHSKIAFIVSIFCMENFLFGNLRSIIEGKTEVPMDETNKMGISKGRFWVRSLDGNQFRIPVKFIETYAQQSCSLCLDFCGELSDISVGSVGTADGYSTVLVRSEKGKRVFDDFKKTIECEPLSQEGLKTIQDLAGLKKGKNTKATRETLTKKRWLMLETLSNLV